MEIHVATIKEADRKVNPAFDTAMIIFSIPAAEGEEEKQYAIEMINDIHLLNKVFEYTNTTSRKVEDLVGKTFRAVFGTYKSAIGHPTEDRFVIPNRSGEFKQEELDI